MKLVIVGLGETFNLSTGDIIHYAQVCVRGITGPTLDIEVSKESYDTLKEVASTLLQHEQESQEWEKVNPFEAGQKSFGGVTVTKGDDLLDLLPTPQKKISLEEALSGEWEEEEVVRSSYKGPFAGVGASPVEEVILSGMGHVPS
jgi:hypothetical protein